LRVPIPPKDLESRLTLALDPDGTVRDGASRELARARQAVRETRQRLVSRLEALLGKLDQRERSPDAAVTVRGGRYVIPIRSTARGQVGGIVHDESASGTTMFVEPPEAIDLGNELRAHELQEQREVLRVLRELTDRIRPQRDALAGAWDMCIAFDDLCARARYAIEVNGFAPIIADDTVVIRKGRHPLLLGGEIAVIPFDLTLEPAERSLLISGPNTGGKTVLIKAVGLICLLAQSGVIPPVGPDSTLPVFQEFFADIGDRQSIAANLSTFSAHVAALRDILDRAGARSLVLIDELGSGTDPAEGAALAGAVLRTLTRRRAVTLATTHLGALKQLATETVGIVNASLQFDAETLTPTYRLLKGVPGRSYGLAIARRLGVSADVLAQAEQALPTTERKLDALLAAVEARAQELELRSQQLDQEARKQEAERATLASREETLSTEARALSDHARKLDDEARAQARAYLLEARRKVEDALALARAAVDEATAREARRLVEKAITETSEEETEKREGWMSLEDLRRQRKAPAPSSRPPVRQSAAVESAPVTSEISLRGMRIDEAEAVLIKALDDAILADLPFLRVIHGKGTGAVRNLVHTILKRDSRVKSFTLAPANQGGSGVTLVEFRS
jgi:DNA mismatch repair protein MutS2